MGNLVGTATMTSSSGNKSCTSGFLNFQVGASGGASVSFTLSATKVGATNDLLLGSPSSAACTDTISFFNVTYCELARNYSGTITDSGAGGTFSLAGLVIVCHSNVTDCTLTVNPGSVGGFANSTGSLVLSNVAFTGSGGVACTTSGSLSATFGPLTYTAGGTGVTPGNGQIFVGT